MHKSILLKCKIIIAASLLAYTSLQAQRTITGNVTDASNSQPLQGTTISVKNTSRSALTDGKGNFVLTKVSNGNVTLVISFIGFIKQTIAVNAADSVVSVLLKEDSNSNLNSVVIVGYQVKP